MREVEKQAILKLLEDAESDGFYGEVTFKLRDGKIYNILKGQSLMLDQLTEKTKA